MVVSADYDGLICAAFLYIADLFHLGKNNQRFRREDLASGPECRYRSEE